MNAVSHQTVKLTKGKHASPDQGACVMELASMLAGEPFSDRPTSVCPVIASFLRAYNDSIDDHRRQDLYAYASKVVGSRVSEAVERARGERLAAWAAKHQRRPWTRLLPPSVLWRLGLDHRYVFETPGAHLVRMIGRHTDETHAQALALIDELLTLDLDEPALSTAGADTTAYSAAAGKATVRASDRRGRGASRHSSDAVP